MSTQDPAPRTIDLLVQSSKDARLGGTLALDSEANCSFTLWLWEDTRRNDGPQPLYGWVIPSAHHDPGRWRVVKKPIGSGTMRYLRLVLSDKSRVIRQVLGALLDGRSLGEASEASALKAPSHGRDFRLLQGVEKSSPLYSVSPIVLLETRDATLNRAKSAIPFRSPNTAAPGWAFSLYLADKQQLRSTLAGKEDKREPDDEGLQEVLEHLVLETGLNFKDAEAGRLGNIDFMAFPSTDEQERPRVDAQVLSSKDGRRKRAEKIHVSIKADGLPKTAQMIVRCRQQIGRETASDVCRLETAGSSELCFDAVEPLGNMTLEVWIREESTDLFGLWFSHRYHWVRRVNIDMGIMGLRSKIDSGLLDAFNSQKLSHRVSRLLDRTQVHYQRVTAGDPDHPWEASVEQGRKMAARLFPQASGARFFAKGWAQEGQLSFFEWMLGVTKLISAGRLVIVDPCFDTDANQMLARMEATQISYAVVTSTQVPSEDDEKGRPARAQRIAATCAAFAPIWRSFHMEILDIQSPSDRGKRPLHDRYFLLFDSGGVLERAFHLSNSIQLATRNYPLLVTPIPEDVLKEVEEYFKQILFPDAKVGSKTRVVQLFTSRPGVDQQSTTVPQDIDPFSLEGAQEVCAIALGDESLRAASGEVLKQRMSGRAMPVEGASRLAETLLRADEAAFHRIWSAWAFICASSNEASELNGAIAKHSDRALAELFAREIRKSTEYRSPVGLAGLPAQHDILVLAHHFGLSFMEALDQAGYFLSRPIRSYGLRAWGPRYAVEVLTSINPDLSVAVAAGLVASLPKSNTDPASGPLLNLLAIVLQPLFDVLAVAPTDELVRALLGSDCDFLRALGARAVANHHRVEPDRAIELLGSLKSNVEVIHALAEWVGDLRIAANRANGVEAADVRARRLQVMDAILSRWTTEGGSGIEISEVFGRVSGPGRGSWSRSTVSELLLPLVNRGVLLEVDVVKLLVSELYQRVASQFADELPEQSGNARQHQYYAATDGELTDVTAALLAGTSPDLRKGDLKRFLDVMGSGWQTLYRPFARSSNYSTWAAARDGLTWASAFLGLLWLHGADAGMDKEELTWILKEAEDNWTRLEGYREKTQYGDPTGLLSFDEQIKDKVRVRRTSGTPSSEV